MLTVPLEAGKYDLVLLSAICHMFSPEENQQLLERAYTALAPHGRLMISDFVLDPDKTAPRFAALFSLNMLVGTRSGASYSEPEYTEWMKHGGFRGGKARSHARSGESGDRNEVIKHRGGCKACAATVLRDRRTLISDRCYRFVLRASSFVGFLTIRQYGSIRLTLWP